MGTSPYVEAVLFDKPVGYWRFEEISGTELENQAGPELGTATSVTLDVQGAFGASRGIGLVGASRVSFGNHFGYEGLAPFTIELWLRPTTHDQRATILRKFTPGGGWRAEIGTQHGLGILRYNASNAHTLWIPQTTAPISTWSHVVFVFDGAQSLIYVNGGSAQGVEPSTLTMTSNGADMILGEGVTGEVDELAIYSKGLAEASIASHYAAASLEGLN